MRIFYVPVLRQLRFLRKFTTTAAATQSETSQTMLRVLNVAEKNDASKSLADLMSGGRYNKREGLSRFNKIYEYQYQIFNRNCMMLMTSVSGHLLGYEFTGQYKKWYGCNPAALFDAPLEKYCPQDYVDIKRTLEREVRNCQMLIIWTDCDREGENIGFEVIDVCRAVKPSIQIYRARFSEITPQAITRAVNNLVAPDKNVSDAVDIRQELDLRIGAAFTRFQTLRLKQVFPDVLAEQLISYGSCQFPTLGFVVERYKQVQAFVQEPFWKIKVTYQSEEEGLVEFTWKRQRLFDYLACFVLYQHCLERPLATVVDVVGKPKSKWRPVALDTVEMEKLASRKLHIGAKETMKIAEKLYTQGYISYPRTETNMFPKDFDLQTLIGQQTNDPNWGAFAVNLLNTGPTPRNGTKTDQAHPPIHPTKYTDNLQGNERAVYEFIVRHFLACCSRDAQGHETTVEIDVHDERFSISGLMIIARNYLDVYPYDKWNAKLIPPLALGATFQPNAIEMNQGETSPPSLLTEADLITLMEKHGIGTDATHAEHIETIKARLYVGVRPDGKFVPGELGMGLVEGYDAMGFQMSKPHLRAELESDLKKICDGTKDKNVVLREQIVKYREVFLQAVQQANKIDEALTQYFGHAQPATEMAAEAQQPVCACPLCQQDMVIKTKKDGNGLYLSCMGYPECRSAVWFSAGVLEASVSDQVCDTCRPGPVHKIHFKFKRGAMPAYFSTDYVGCIGGCDEDLNTALDIRFPRRQAAGSVAAVTGTQVRNASYDSGISSGSSGSNSFLSPPTPQPPRPTQTIRPSVISIKPTVRQPLSQANNGGNRPGLMSAENPSRGQQQTATSARNNSVGGNNVVVCHCSEDAKLLTVRKEGPNTGRQFYACSKPPDTKCDFFLWADVSVGSDDSSNDTLSQRGNNNVSFRNAPADVGARTAQWGNGNRGGGVSNNIQSSGPIKCGCGTNAKQLTVQKDGPNKGRPFYSCSKPMNQGCGFFQWSDQPAAGTNNQPTGRFGASIVSNSRAFPTNNHNMADADPGAKKKRKCGICGQEGHNRKNCPKQS